MDRTDTGKENRERNIREAADTGKENRETIREAAGEQGREKVGSLAMQGSRVGWLSSGPD